MAARYECPFPIYSLEEGDRYEVIRKRRLIGCKIIDGPTLAKLNLQEAFDSHLRRWGLQWFGATSHHTYTELTREFFTTLKRKENVESEYSFRLRGVRHSFDMRWLRTNCEMRSGGIRIIPPEYQRDQMWRELSGEPVFQKDSKANLIKDVSVLLAFKWYKYNICGIEEANKVGHNDLIVIYALLHPDDDTLKINMAYRILEMVLKMQQQRAASPLGMGLIVSALAECFQAYSTEEEWEALQQPKLKYIDMDYLKKCNVVDANNEIIPFYKRTGWVKKYGPVEQPEAEDDQDEGAEGQQTEHVQESAQGTEATEDPPVFEEPLQPPSETDWRQRIEDRQRRMEARQRRMLREQRDHHRMQRAHMRATHPQGDYPSPVYSPSPEPEDY